MTPSREALFRIVAALVADELGARRGGAIDPAESRGWTEATTIDEDGLGVDSLARLELVARVAGFFHMPETGAEDYLLVHRSLGDWAEIVGESLKRYAARVTFQTSGSTGAPKRIAHEWADLDAEAEAAAAALPGVRRVLALAPPHHIYGFLWTVLLPQAAGAAVCDLRGLAPGAALREAGPGDLIVATPFLWDLALRSGGDARGAIGLTSTAPAPARLWDAARAGGVARLLEIYGSTETGGLGWRDAADSPFGPAPHLLRDGETLRRARDGVALAPPDDLAWTADGRFRPAGRRDGAVQVGGVNVWPERVAAVLAEHPLAAECAVRLDHETARLKAFVRPAAEADPAALQAALSRFAAERLTPPERPTRFDVGPALPRTETGKLRDWATAD